MKRLASVFALNVVVMTVGFATDVGDDATNVKTQGMSIRLELFVDDMEKSADFYTNALGFERLKGQPDYIPIRSGSVVIGLGPAAKLSKQHYFNPELRNSRRGLGTEIVLEVNDVHAHFAKVKAAGCSILTPPQKRPWGATDFRVADPDGYYLRITSR